MNQTVPEPDQHSVMDDEPYVRLPRPLPRWIQRAVAIEMAIQLAVVAVALLMVAAGAMLWAVRGGT